MGELCEMRNKQIDPESLRGSRQLFRPHSESFPHELGKRHSFLNNHYVKKALGIHISSIALIDTIDIATMLHLTAEPRGRPVASSMYFY